MLSNVIDSMMKDSKRAVLDEVFKVEERFDELSLIWDWISHRGPMIFTMLFPAYVACGRSTSYGSNEPLIN